MRALSMTVALKAAQMAASFLENFVATHEWFKPMIDPKKKKIKQNPDGDEPLAEEHRSLIAMETCA